MSYVSMEELLPLMHGLVVAIVVDGVTLAILGGFKRLMMLFSIPFSSQFAFNSIYQANPKRT